MSLPTLTTPKFELTIPSTGETLKFRAFLVKEQKLILQAIEMGDAPQLNEAIEDIVTSCTFEKFDVNAATVYDVEFVLLNIRAKSAGEIVEMIYTCNAPAKPKHDERAVGGYQPVPNLKCSTKINVSVPLLKAEIIRPKDHQYKIMLSDELGMTMQDLPYSAFKKVSGLPAGDAGLEVVTACIKTIFDADNVYSDKDFTKKELMNFVESMTGQQFAMLEQFIDTMPYLSLDLPMRCPACGTEDVITLRGLDDFLA